MRVFGSLSERTRNFDELNTLLNNTSMREHKQTPCCASQVHSLRDLLIVVRHVFIACSICGPALTKLHLFNWGSEGDFTRTVRKSSFARSRFTVLIRHLLAQNYVL